jgi:hypothetical protein
MQDWKAHIDAQHPCWNGYRGSLAHLPGEAFPSPEALGRLLPAGLTNVSGHPIRFRAADEFPGVAYEKHIYESGEVSTRKDSWHDLFNALAWCRFPRLKSAMNAVHYQHLGEEHGGRRGKQRDALTLLDESGVIVTGSSAPLLEALAARDWKRAFIDLRDAWDGTAVMICGHAILEKFLQPYKSLTAHALYLHSDPAMPAGEMDEQLAEALLDGHLLRTPRDLSPLPLMGIPGWWAGGEQDEAFYADKNVFRPPPAN